MSAAPHAFELSQSNLTESVKSSQSNLYSFDSDSRQIFAIDYLAASGGNGGNDGNDGTSTIQAH
jgi:N-methylhydantoinase B/oxoprolinase/acetone carboxylase alpha subunit